MLYNERRKVVQNKIHVTMLILTWKGKSKIFLLKELQYLGKKTCQYKRLKSKLDSAFGEKAIRVEIRRKLYYETSKEQE